LIHDADRLGQSVWEQRCRGECRNATGSRRAGGASWR